jgi:hypothetical protein
VPILVIGPEDQRIRKWDPENFAWMEEMTRLAKEKDIGIEV